MFLLSFSLRILFGCLYLSPIVSAFQPIIPLITFPTVSLPPSSNSPYQLLVDRYPSTPPSLALGIESPNPTFEWAVPSIIDEQKSVRIIVTLFTNTSTILWDSGYVNTSVSSLTYQGPSLAKATRYVWTVVVMGTTSSNSLLISTDSSTGEFVTGLYGSTLNSSTIPLWVPNSTIAYPMFAFLRCEATLLEDISTIVSATTFITAAPTISVSQAEIDNSKLLGAYKLWINNALQGMGPGKISRCGPLCPVQHASGVCNCQSEHIYDVRDITAATMLASVNTITIAITGFNYPPVPELYIDSRIMLEIIIEYSSGTRQVIGTNTDTWKAFDGTNYMGPDGNFGMSAWYYSPRENFDARLEPVGWRLSGYNYSSSSLFNWTTPVAVAAFPQRLIARPTPAVVVTDDPAIVNPPYEILYYNDTNRIFVDMGIEFTGGVCMDVYNNTVDGLQLYMELAEEVEYIGEGANLTLWTRPMRTGNNYTQTWTLRIDNEQTLCMHEYGQFRYVQFTVINNSPRYAQLPFLLSSLNINVRAWVVYYPAQYIPVDAFQFISNDDPKNADDALALQSVWEISHYTRMAQSMDMYFDHVRQRDVYCVEELTIDIFQQYSLSSEWLAQPFTLSYVINNRPVDLGWAEWPVLEIFSVYEIYMYANELTLFRNNYAQLRNFTLLSLIDNRTVNGTKLWTCNFSAPLFDCNQAEVDWPPSSRDGFVFTPTNTVVNSIVYRGMLMFAEMANAIGGHDDDVALFTNTANALRIAINTLLWNNNSGYIDGLTTVHKAFHSSVFALGMGVPLDSMMESVVYNGIMNRLPVKNSSATVCFPSNVWPTQWLLEGLYNYYDADHGVLGYELLVCNLPQGWVQMLYNNFTQAPEAWNNDVKGNEELGMTWGAAPGDVIPRYLLGIRPLLPGFRAAMIKPQIGATLQGIIGTVPSINGFFIVKYSQITITNSSNKNGISIVQAVMSLSLPGNSVAVVCLAMDACRTNSNQIMVDGVLDPLSFQQSDYICVNITSKGMMDRRLQCGV